MSTMYTKRALSFSREVHSLLRTYKKRSASRMTGQFHNTLVTKICQSSKQMGSNSQRIPEGKGPYSVGCTDLMTGYSIQGIFLRLYYPSQNCMNNEDTTWIPRKEYYYGLSDFLNIYRKLGEFIFARYVGSVTCPAKWNAEFKPGEKYPLIIFSHGLGAFRTLYSAICIEMASQGFVVAAVEHRDQSSSATYYCKENSNLEAKPPPSELHKEWIYYRKLKANEDEVSLRRKQVQQRADECIRALDLLLEINSGNPAMNVLPLNFNWSLLKDSIDLQKIAAMGHSFGAATAIETLSKDARFQCGIALDAWMFPLSDEVYPKIHQPLLFINSEKFQWAVNILEMKKLNCKGRERKMITIKGSVHQSFPDFTFFAGNIVGKFFKLKGDIDPKTAIDISNKASLAFLQKHLGLSKDFNQWDPLLDGEGLNVIPDTNIDLTPVASE
ncbi:platelet-activating factor acetylhydrolase isoform X1 [Python bivittatus]|uniref:Platelet-activating factor acetylhydrolase n=2 Tax=Python bivittatus TaxID=176946 RepID=A0A9F5IQG6_PYTBI|nr:platelet-activating factor acetylhydrolase isoform X1 [Python bivittatus]XP_025021553.1 platelet-activating factor acetylhydrolase isoform X1 [Python bivittatus]